MRRIIKNITKFIFGDGTTVQKGGIVLLHTILSPTQEEII